MSHLSVFIGMLIGNIIMCLTDHINYDKAFDICYYQAIVLFTHYIAIKIKYYVSIKKKE